MKWLQYIRKENIDENGNDVAVFATGTNPSVHQLLHLYLTAFCFSIYCKNDVINVMATCFHIYEDEIAYIFMYSFNERRF